MIFIDTNILIDIVAPGQSWRDWSAARIEALGAEDILVVNQIVLAELASGFPTLQEATQWLAQMGIEVRSLEDEAAFLAGTAFRRYRKSERNRTSILSDFLIGGHATALEATLMTRDPAIYRRYFPELTLITPENDHD